MPTNNLALHLLDCASYQQINNAGVREAIANIARQLPTYRSAATAVAAVGQLRDLIFDILAAQDGHCVGVVTTPAESAELLLSDSVAVGSLTVIRGYLSGLHTTKVASPLPGRQSFTALVRTLSEAI